MSVRTGEQGRKPIGAKAELLGGGLPEVISAYMLKRIEEHGGPTGKLGLQFFSQTELEHFFPDGETDPLDEDEHEVAPGLVYKYRAHYNEKTKVFVPGRALFTPTFHCATYCRYCTRGREVGERPPLTLAQVNETLSFIENEPGLNEVILSGGDPLTLPPKILGYILGRLGEMQRSGKLKIVRIGTRLPSHNPVAFKQHHYEAISQLVRPRIMWHVNCVDELSPETRDVMENLLNLPNRAEIYSQSVLLKGVNYFEDEDGNPLSAELHELFRELTYMGVHPYYVYMNDPVNWATHFTAPIEKVKKMVKTMRADDSGIVALPRFVFDVPHGMGKVPLHEGQFTDDGVIDYLDIERPLINR